jgi:hypothetical protein
MITLRDIIELSRQRILDLCRQHQEKRQSAFKSGGTGDFENEYIDNDFVKLKYDAKSFVGSKGRWIEDEKHFGHRELIDQIIENNGKSPRNILIEVNFIYCANVVHF